jgi:phosphoribosylanthranilate isomerase
MKTGKKPLHAEMMIKVCGMKEPDNIRSVAALTPMMMGFIFYKGSPRYAGELAPEVVNELPEHVRPVAVFVDASEEEMCATCSRYGIKIVQLHGNESPDVCRRMKERGFTVFKAVALTDASVLDTLNAYVGCIDMFVFDSHSPGSGKQFDHSLLENYDTDVPYLLSGGIGPDDIPTIVAAMRPGMAGIDINSRFEVAPGVKNLRVLINFILSLRTYNEYESNNTPFWEK